MFLWILIIFAIALIFGVIKTEDLKNLSQKLLNNSKTLMSDAAAKTAEFREKLNEKTDSDENNTKDSAK